jgi:guanylate kinase
MARRLEVAHRELLQSHHYRHRVVNDNDVAAAVTAIEKILFASGLPNRPAQSRQQHNPDHASQTPSGAQT